MEDVHTVVHFLETLFASNVYLFDLTALKKEKKKRKVMNRNSGWNRSDPSNRTSYPGPIMKSLETLIICQGPSSLRRSWGRTCQLAVGHYTSSRAPISIDWLLSHLQNSPSIFSGISREITSEGLDLLRGVVHFYIFFFGRGLEVNFHLTAPEEKDRWLLRLWHASCVDNDERGVVFLLCLWCVPAR